MPVTGLSPQFQFASWRVPQFPRAIEYPLEVMEEIRAFACDELLQLSHGGDEVGGVLFGTRRDDLIRILTWRPIACEHTQGEGLRLSYNDRMNLAVQLEMARQNPDLKDLRPLGWFVSHLQGGVALSATDLEIYNGFFPESWQVTLAICPRGGGSAQAGFFIREAEDKVAAESSYRCFDLEALHLAPDIAPAVIAPHAVAPPPVIPPLVAPPPVSSPPVSSPPVSSPPVWSPPVSSPLVVSSIVASPAPKPEPKPEPKKDERVEASPPDPAPTVPSPVAATPPQPVRDRAPATTPPAPTVQPAPPQPPRVWAPVSRPEPLKAPPVQAATPPQSFYQPSFEMEETLPTRDRWLWAIPIVLALGIAAFMLYQRRAPNAIALRASNEAQTVQLVWDGNSRAIRDAVRGEIDINDGGNASQVSLSSEQLHAGKLSYLPQSGDVSFVLTVHPANGEPLHDSTRLLAPAFHAPTEAPQLLPANPAPAQPVAAQPGPTHDAQAQQLQIQQLNAQLTQERARANELQNLVRILENRLGIQPEERQPH